MGLRKPAPNLMMGEELEARWNTRAEFLTTHGRISAQRQKQRPECSQVQSGALPESRQGRRTYQTSVTCEAHVRGFSHEKNKSPALMELTPLEKKEDNEVNNQKTFLRDLSTDLC